MYPRWKDTYTILLLLFAGTLFSDSARCQTESFEALPSLPSPAEDTLQIPAGGSFDISTLAPGTFERDLDLAALAKLNIVLGCFHSALRKKQIRQNVRIF